MEYTWPNIPTVDSKEGLMQLAHYCLFTEKSTKQPFWGKNELNGIGTPPHPHPPGLISKYTLKRVYNWFLQFLLSILTGVPARSNTTLG